MPITGLLVFCQDHSDCQTIERTKGETVDEIIKSFNVDKNARNYVIEFLDEQGDYLGYYDPTENYLYIRRDVVERGLVECLDEFEVVTWS
jgi:hypothetical protein